MKDKIINSLIEYGKKHKWAKTPVLGLIYVILFIYHINLKLSKSKKFTIAAGVLAVIGIQIILMHGASALGTAVDITVVNSRGVLVTTRISPQVTVGEDVIIDYLVEEGYDLRDIKLSDIHGNNIEVKTGDGQIEFRVPSTSFEVEIIATKKLTENVAYSVVDAKAVEYEYEYEPTCRINIYNDSANNIRIDDISLNSVDGFLLEFDRKVVQAGNVATAIVKLEKNKTVGTYANNVRVSLVEEIVSISEIESTGEIETPKAENDTTTGQEETTIEETTAEEEVSIPVEETTTLQEDDTTEAEENETTVENETALEEITTATGENTTAEEITTEPETTIEYKDYSLNFDISFEVNKKVLTELTSPKTSRITYGDDLGSSKISNEGYEGVFSWRYENTKLNAGTFMQDVVFTPNKNNNYDYSNLSGYNKENGKVLIKAEVSVDKKVLNISYKDKIINVGDEVPKILAEDYIVSGFVGRDGMEVLSGVASIEFSAATSNVAGTYYTQAYPKITASNYEVKFAQGKLICNAVTPNENYFTVNGSKSPDGGWYNGEITISASGINGFDGICTEEGVVSTNLKINGDCENGQVKIYFVKGGAKTEGYLFRYSIDSTKPEITINKTWYDGGVARSLSGYTVGSGNFHVQILVGDNLSGVRRCTYTLNGQTYTASIKNGLASIEINEETIGDVVIGLEDYAGNYATATLKNVVVDYTKPSLSVNVPASDEGVVRVPNVVTVNVSDGGAAPSGIRKIEYSIDGGQNIISEISDYNTEASVRVPFYEEGTHILTVHVTDNSGNTYEYMQSIDLKPSVIICVEVPTNSTITVDPFNINGKGQIYSEEIFIKNKGNTRLEGSVETLNCQVNTGVFNGVSKDCNIFLNLDLLPNQAFSLNKGINNNVCSFILGSSGEEENKDNAALKFNGYISTGSEELWKPRDIKIDIVFMFEVLE